ncbi:formylglycine-generating enzyme family protein [Flavobacterium sp. H122]|uniref:formylglycine-generating enzyme family protein n=1 Tax=Flavobacterium sp. H122 TaxID=2529860 RepID=UPI0010AA7F6F|nr:formylglycine-generating enzyme family protein [Flavobacterium sp. H122]
MKNLYFLVFAFVLISCQKNDDFKNVENINKPSISTPKDTSFGVETPMVFIKGGSYVPLYGKQGKPVTVTNFYMDVYPVTNENFAAFVKQNKRWQKSEIKRIFADENYLYSWKNNDGTCNTEENNHPVTNVSWYAANAYCECQGKRLATVDEWEYVAMANEKMPDARKEKIYNQYILDWYEKTKAYDNEVGKTFKNYYGVYDMHGLVWEWTSDFSSILLTGESRSDVTTDKNLFCGSGSLNASDLMNYAAFMRYAFRGSTKADYTIRNLGFRCVKDTLK